MTIDRYQSVARRGEDVELFRLGIACGRLVLVLADELGHDEFAARAYVEACGAEWPIEVRYGWGTQVFDGGAWLPEKLYV